MVIDNDSFMTKAKNFFILNWWSLWIVIMVSMITTVYLSMQTRADMKEAKEMMEKNSKGVVMLSYAGVPIYGEKAIIDIQDENFKKTLKAILQKYLIIDASRLTMDYTDVPSSIEEMFNKNENMNDFTEYFLKAKEDPNAFTAMKEHLRTLLALIRADNLPETITLLSSKIDKYEIDNNSFLLSMYADTKIEYYLQEKKDWERKRGTIRIEAKGHFDTQKGDAFNPLGVKIDWFKVAYPKKREK